MDLLHNIEANDTAYHELRQGLPVTFLVPQPALGAGTFEVPSDLTDDGKPFISVDFKSPPEDWFVAVDHFGRQHGRHKGRYTVSQPRLVLDGLREAIDHHIDGGFVTSNCSFREFLNGARFHISYPLGKFAIGGKDDECIFKLMYRSSMDGSMANLLAATVEREICVNGLVVTEGIVSHKSRHTLNSTAKMYSFLASMGELLNSVETLIGTFNRAAKVQISEEDVQKFACYCLKVDYKAYTEKSEQVSKRTLNAIDTLLTDIQTEMAYSPSAWGLFNGATRYATHSATRKADQDVQYFLNYGTGAKVNDRAMAWLGSKVG